MKALVIYDSVFGNTEQIARAMGDALGFQAQVNVLRVDAVQPEHLMGLNVLIVGSPTRAFSPTPAIKNLLKDIAPNGLQGVKVAAFDTRMVLSDVNSRILAALVKLFGYAAQPIADRLKKKGGILIVSPEGFFVEDSEGPLKDGELERAAEWAKQIVATQ